MLQFMGLQRVGTSGDSRGSARGPGHVPAHPQRVLPPSTSPSPPLTESTRLFYTSVSLLLSRTQGYCYHLSKFHIYAPSAQRLVWAAKQPLGKAALGALFA